MDDLNTLIDDLRGIDFGYAEGAGEVQREHLLRRLEDIVDQLELLHGLSFPEAEAAIRHFTTNVPLARTYVYGPTDMGDGRGLLEKLLDLVTV